MSSDGPPRVAEDAPPPEAGRAISVSHLGKCYQIYEKPQHRLLQGLFRGRRQFFREFWALRDVSFDVRLGETIGIIGRNGSGKSTLLQIVCGTLSPTLGEVDVTGRVAALLELGAGFNPEFTGRENVFMNATVLGLTPAEIRDRLDDIAAFADIGEFIDQPVKTYSSGMYVRLAFAVIAHVNADILVIDEALAVGDAYFSQKCMRFLRRFREHGTLLFVSHDTGAVVNLCDRVIWLEQGGVRAIGGARTVCDDYLQAVYESQQGASNVPTTPASPVNGEEDSDRVAPELQVDSAIDDAFSSGRAFGVGGASITHVSIRDPRGARVRVVSRDQRVVLTVVAVTRRELFSPIIGFTLRDRLGQALFAENTFIWTPTTSFRVPPGEALEARFEFVLPRLALGDYAFSVSIAEGTQLDHVQHHWVHDALVITSQPDQYCLGLVGLDVREASLVSRGRASTSDQTDTPNEMTAQP